MSLALQLVIRILAAAALGAAIGYEREIRTKSAGVRTHVLVALGAALFMIISQYGFGDSDKFDAARVAAGVVTGIGFLGGGIIIKLQKNHVVGLTTAAGLWVTAAIGLASGCGMFEMAVLCAALVLFCLEAMHFWSVRLGNRNVTVVLSSANPDALSKAVTTLGRQVERTNLSKQGDLYKMEIDIRVRKKENPMQLIPTLTAMEGVQLESLE
ncbi:MAG: MgtC/SapB family protein [Bacteroidales bacterium]|nr:MgtC/SapB family protein [Bacteroidales bacterium]MBQ9528758.1 MgtC/SapB family protein [Bacteroidales bacterium]